MLTDTHFHFEDERYHKDREDVIEANLGELAFGVNVTADPKDLEKVAELSQTFEKIYAALGVHPHYALRVTPEEVREKIEATLRQAQDADKIVGIGECGLDYYFKNQSLDGRTEFEVRDAQAELFRAQIDLAKEKDLPLVVHTRDEQGGWDAYQDILRIFDEKDVNKGVVHSFSGNIKFAKEFTERGFYLGISGILTFDKTGKLPESIEKTDLDNLLLETDAPYLTPVPHRGKRNEPRFTRFIAEEIAEIKNISYDEVVEATEQNARKLFGI